MTRLAIGPALIGTAGILLLAAGCASAPSPASEKAALRTAMVDPSSAAQPKLSAADGASGDRFGYALALDGDTLVVTAPETSVGGLWGAGAAYVYSRDAADGSWTQQARLVAGDPRAEAGFGLEAVAANGDVIAVAASRATRGALWQEGAVYLFARDPAAEAGWREIQILTDERVGAIGWFGRSLALRDDLLAVGARAGGDGLVTLHERQPPGSSPWATIATVGESDVADGGADEDFGSALALDGDWLLIGAAGADVSGLHQNDGAAYLFRRAADERSRFDLVSRLVASEASICVAGLTLEEFRETHTDELQAADDCANDPRNDTDGDSFGAAVAFGGDRIVIGAPNAEGGDGEPAGAVYVFEPDATEPVQWREAARLVGAQAYGRFGGAVAIDGDSVLVGAASAAVGSKSSQGLVYRFARAADGGWQQVEVVASFDGVSGDYFGSALVANAEATVVGATGSDRGRGSAYVLAPYGAAPGAPTPPEEPPPPFAITGTIENDTLHASASGVLLGAAQGSALAPVEVWIHEVAAPAEPMFGGAIPVGPYVNVGAGTAVGAPLGSAFGLALPVPPEADPSRLSAAVLASAGAVLDGLETGSFWLPAGGHFDEATRYFVLSLFGLSREGITVVLTEQQSPSLASPAPGTSSARGLRSPAAPTATSSFTVTCSGFDAPALCGPAEEAEIALELETALQAYLAAGFPDPRFSYLSIVPVALTPTVPGYVLVPTSTTSHPPTYVWPATDFVCNQLLQGVVAGFFYDVTRSMVVCMPPNAVTSLVRVTLRHELFHAVQMGGGGTLRGLGRWALEGTATAVAGASAPPKLERSPSLGPRRIDLSLLEGSLLDALSAAERELPYQTQDFWIYLGREGQLKGPVASDAMSYLVPVLAGGLWATAVDSSLAQQFGTSLGNAYWDWAKHRAVEGTAASTGFCVFDDQAVDAPLEVNYSEGARVAEGTLDNLASEVALIYFPDAEARNVTVAVERLGPSDDGLEYKVYLENEPLADCDDALPDGERRFSTLPKGSVLIVIISSVLVTSEQQYVEGLRGVPEISFRLSVTENVEGPMAPAGTTRPPIP